jgi:hypothetical protein
MGKIAQPRLPPPTGSAFSGLRLPGTGAVTPSIHAILSWSIGLKRWQVRCNGLLGGGALRGHECDDQPQKEESRNK